MANGREGHQISSSFQLRLHEVIFLEGRRNGINLRSSLISQDRYIMEYMWINKASAYSQSRKGYSKNSTPGRRMKTELGRTLCPYLLAWQSAKNHEMEFKWLHF